MKWFSIDAKIGRTSSIILAAIPFILLIGIYIAASEIRHAENPKDKVIPTVGQITKAFYNSFAKLDVKGERPLIKDTLISAQRFGISLLVLVAGVFIGLHMGVLPILEKLLYRFLLFFHKIPALALLPILFIIFGLEEESKIAIIVIGVLPTIMLDTYQHAKAIPSEQIQKGKTLKASDAEITYRIVLPQILPRVVDTFRINFNAIMLFLISAEALASSSGLGYRIFVVRRYMQMDMIIAYVIWMSLLVFLADLGMRFWIQKRYRWFNK